MTLLPQEIPTLAQAVFYEQLKDDDSQPDSTQRSLRAGRRLLALSTSCKVSRPSTQTCYVKETYLGIRKRAYLVVLCVVFLFLHSQGTSGLALRREYVKDPWDRQLHPEEKGF
jgi:hypothetical protein